METLLALLVRLILTLLRALPIRVVARIGSLFGALAFHLDKRHRQVALLNLRTAFPDLPPSEIQSLAKENFRRIGENFACGACTARMNREQLEKIVEVAGVEKLLSRPAPRNYVFAIGHFGNFELLAHLNQYLPGFAFATTYRAIRPPAVNDILTELRESSGCEVFERRSEALALRARMNQGKMALGLLSDQSDGERGLRIPFLGTDASTSTAPALFALRYSADFYTAFVYRTAPGRWRVEVGDLIPTVIDGKPREPEDITREMNAAFEAAVRRDPANWFWVHDRWRLARKRRKQQLPVVN